MFYCFWLIEFRFAYEPIGSCAVVMRWLYCKRLCQQPIRSLNHLTIYPIGDSFYLTIQTGLAAPASFIRRGTCSSPIKMKQALYLLVIVLFIVACSACQEHPGSKKHVIPHTLIRSIPSRLSSEEQCDHCKDGVVTAGCPVSDACFSQRWF